MIRFSKFFWLYGLISGTFLLIGLFFLVTSGLKQSVDFSGGTLVEVSFKPDISREKIEQTALKKDVNFSSIQKTGSEYMLRSKQSDSNKISELLATLSKESSVTATIKRQEVVGPILGKELLAKALVAAVFAILAILSYVAYAFKKFVFGLSAVIALIHDLLIVVGSFAVFGALWGVEVDTLFITAVLTTMSFSVHDTIVVFDRIRELQKKSPRSDLAEISDYALTETMGRSLANSITIILMLVALVLMGGETVRWFAVALLIGTISGTYSSPFVATPGMVLISKWKKL